MRILTPEFENNHSIPEQFTCVGRDINPEILIEDIPPNAKSLALTVVDPESTFGGYWAHWVVYDIPVTSRIFEESIPGTQGTNSFGKPDYGGPCPVSGTHRYIFTVYALDENLDLPEGLSREEFLKAAEGHILAQAGMHGFFKKPPQPVPYREIKI